MTKKLSILQLCNKPPFPPMDGGAIGMHNVSQGIIDAGHQLKILSFSSNKHRLDISKLPKDYLQSTGIEAVDVDLSIRMLPALYNLLYSRHSYNISRFNSKEMRLKLEELLSKESFDIIQLESIFLKDYLPLIRKFSQAKVVLRAPNVEFVIWQRLAQIEKNPIKRFYLGILAKRLRKEEVAVLNSFDAIYTVTERDMQLMRSLGARVKMTFIPTGVDVNKDLTTDFDAVEYPSVFHLGALDWSPNIEGVKWMLNQVWPSLHSRFPELKFYIAGRRPPQWLQELKEDGVVVVGEVEDAGAFIKSKAIMPVPLFSGSGMRVKIIEAMMLQKAVVSTGIGIEGIIHEDGENVLIANDAAAFIDSIALLVENKDLYKRIAISAKNNANKFYSNKVLNAKLMEFFYSL